MSKNFYDAVKERRTIYSISKESTISNERVQQVVEDAIKHTPSAFNSQSARVVILFGAHHDKLWDITKEALRKIVPADSFAETEAKINSFQLGAGTILFFEDQKTVQYFQEQFALYKDNFPVWSQQAAGMNQYVVWTSLELEGLGASLQHYNELIEADVKSQWSVPSTYKLVAQMPFGKPTAPAGDKTFLPLEERVKVFF